MAKIKLFFHYKKQKMASTSPDLFERYMKQSHASPDLERFSVSPDFSHRIHEKVFCTENNVEQCIAYLNQVCTF